MLTLLQTVRCFRFPVRYASCVYMKSVNLFISIPKAPAEVSETFIQQNGEKRGVSIECIINLLCCFSDISGLLCYVRTSHKGGDKYKWRKCLDI